MAISSNTITLKWEGEDIKNIFETDLINCIDGSYFSIAILKLLWKCGIK